MGLFGFGKKECGCDTKVEQKKNNEQVPACACKGAIETFEATGADNVAKGIASVKVLGSGCKSCHELLVNTNKALKTMAIPFEAEYITDIEKVVAYGVMSTPALVVNEKVVSMGKVYSVAEVEKLLHKLGY